MVAGANTVPHKCITGCVLRQTGLWWLERSAERCPYAEMVALCSELLLLAPFTVLRALLVLDVRLEVCTVYASRP